MASIDIEGHGFTVFTTVNMLNPYVVQATAPQTASLSDENRVDLRGFHGRENSSLC